MRIMASSWRMVMGMEERVEEASSEEWICRRMVTKCEESFSPASGERRGAQRLGRGDVSVCYRSLVDRNSVTYDLQ